MVTITMMIVAHTSISRLIVSHSYYFGRLHVNANDSQYEIETIFNLILIRIWQIK